MDNFFKIDRAQIAYNDKRFEELSNLVGWHDQNGDFLYQTEEFVKTGEIGEEDYQLVVESYLALQGLRKLQNGTHTPEDIKYILKVVKKRESSPVFDDLGLSITIGQEAMFPLIEKTFNSPDDNLKIWSLEILHKLFKPENFLRLYLPHEAQCNPRISPYLEKRFLGIFWPLSPGRPFGYASSNQSPVKFDRGCIYEESTESGSRLKTPENEEYIWSHHSHHFYHPETFDHLGFTWEMNVIQDGIVRESYRHIAVKDGSGYRVTSLSANKISYSFIGVPEGLAVNLEKSLIIDKLIKERTAKSGDSYNIPTIKIMPGKVVLEEETSEIVKTGKEIHVVSKSMGNGETLSVYALDGRLISTTTQGMILKPIEENREITSYSAWSGIKMIPVNGQNLERYNEITYRISAREVPSYIQDRFEVKSLPNNQFEFTVSRGRVQKNASPEEKYLASNNYIQADNPEIKRTAASISKDQPTAKDKVAAILEWMKINITKGDVLTQNTALDVLENKRGDCSEHAVLFIALARALKIPARGVSGFLYSESDQGFVPHQWAEYHDGEKWVVVDPVLNQKEADTAHLGIVEGDISAEDKIVELMSTMKISVIDTN